MRSLMFKPFLVFLFVGFGLSAKAKNYEQLANLDVEIKPDVVMAQNCSGVWSLIEVERWRDAGDELFSDFSKPRELQDNIKIHADKISRYARLLTLEGGFVRPSSRYIFLSGGQFHGFESDGDKPKSGCRATPLAVRAQLVNPAANKKEFYFNEDVYEQLPPVDQYVSQLLILGRKPSVLRTLFTVDHLSLDFLERIKLYKSRGLTTIDYRKFDIVILDDAIIYHENGMIKEAIGFFDERLRVALFLSFYESGRVNFLLRDISRSVNLKRYSDFNMYRSFLKEHSFPKKLFPDAPIFYDEPITDGVQCGEWIAYREDGSLSYCDYDYYYSDGVKIDRSVPPIRSIRPQPRPKAASEE